MTDAATCSQYAPPPSTRRSDAGEAGEPSGPQDGLLGNLAALDRVPAQLLRIGDQALGVEHVDRSDLGPGAGRVHVGVVARWRSPPPDPCDGARPGSRSPRPCRPGAPRRRGCSPRTWRTAGRRWRRRPRAPAAPARRRRPSRRGRRCGARPPGDPCAARRASGWLSPDRRAGSPTLPESRTSRTATTASPTRTSCVATNEAHMAGGPGSDSRSAGLHANSGSAR